jgi:hypothetical protein
VGGERERERKRERESKRARERARERAKRETIGAGRRLPIIMRFTV